MHRCSQHLAVQHVQQAHTSCFPPAADVHTGAFTGHPQVQAAASKRYTRACNKMFSDYRFEEMPRGKKNVDVIRTLCEPSTPALLLQFLGGLVAEFGGGVAKLKNIFASNKDERASRFNLSCIMAILVYDTGLTYGELAALPETQATWAAHCARPDGEPGERWSRCVQLNLIRSTCEAWHNLMTAWA